jgi:hypothetical protein
MSALRSFKAFTNVAPVSPSVLIDALGTTTETLIRPCTLVALDGYAAAAGWFQIFDLAVAPTTGVTVPLKSFNVSAAGPLPSLFQTLGPVVLNKGLYVAMSSTEAVYTAVATNFDVYGEVVEHELQLSGTSVAGDLTTQIDYRLVWTDGNGPKKLIRVDILPDGLTGTRYLMLLPVSAQTAGQIPLAQWALTDSTSVQSLHFGVDGLGVYRTSAGVLQKACQLILSDTAGVLAYASDGSGDSIKMRVFYK